MANEAGLQVKDIASKEIEGVSAQRIASREWEKAIQPPALK